MALQNDAGKYCLENRQRAASLEKRYAFGLCMARLTGAPLLPRFFSAIDVTHPLFWLQAVPEILVGVGSLCAIFGLIWLLPSRKGPRVTELYRVFGKRARRVDPGASCPDESRARLILLRLREALAREQNALERNQADLQNASSDVRRLLTED